MRGQGKCLRKLGKRSSRSPDPRENCASFRLRREEWSHESNREMDRGGCGIRFGFGCGWNAGAAAGGGGAVSPEPDGGGGNGVGATVTSSSVGDGLVRVHR